MDNRAIVNLFHGQVITNVDPQQDPTDLKKFHKHSVWAANYSCLPIAATVTLDHKLTALLQRLYV